MPHCWGHLSGIETCIFQQNNSMLPPHFLHNLLAHLNQNFVEQWIGCGGLHSWAQSSPALSNAVRFFVYGDKWRILCTWWKHIPVRTLLAQIMDIPVQLKGSPWRTKKPIALFLSGLLPQTCSQYTEIESHVFVNVLWNLVKCS